jgi:uncharacterized membrane protein
MASLKRTESRRKFFKSFEAKSLRKRSFLTQISDELTAFCGSTGFLVFHVFFFTTWVIINVGLIDQIPPFDPYPFGFLTMVVSLEAIFLAIFVLVSQNRSAYISTIRDEVHLGVNIIAEEEITKILELLAEIRGQIGIKKQDPQLEKMLDRIDTGYIERSILEQMSRANKSVVRKMLADIEPIANPSNLIHPENYQNIYNANKSESKNKKT